MERHLLARRRVSVSRSNGLDQFLACIHADPPLFRHVLPLRRPIRRIAIYVRQRVISGSKPDESMRSIGKHRVPFAKGLVGGDHRALGFIVPAHQLEQQIGVPIGVRQVAAATFTRAPS
jgi:hypothetical protein